MAAIGMLWAKRHDAAVFRNYHERVFEKFGELDIEDPEIIATTLTACGANTSGFKSHPSGRGAPSIMRFVGKPRRRACSACPLSSLTASFSAAAST